jgi:Holliday junction resolvasome RuvABC endonuclease subunit
MKLGIRCFPDKFAFAVLDGTSSKPELIEHDVRKIPSDLSRAGFLDWISKEVKGILGRRRVNEAAYKKIEPKAQKNANLLKRAEVEGVVQAVLYESGCRRISGFTKSQLKSRLGFEGPAGEVVDVLLSSPLRAQHGKDPEEACLAAWALLE